MDNAQSAETTVDKKKIKRDKVRSAWISFAGRIVAQIVGAIATVALGVMVLHRYTSTETRPPAAELRYDADAQAGHPNAAAALGSLPAIAVAQPGQQPVNVIIITPAMLGLRDADLPPATERSCAPTLGSAAASTAHLNSPAFTSR
jgi:hypothetical protein